MKHLLTITSLLFYSLFTFGQNQNISQGFVFDGEPYISIDPNNSQHMVVAWMSWTLLNRIVIKTKTTFDGGEIWSNAVILDHAVTGFTSADPSLEFDHNGNIFASYVDYSGYDVSPFEGGVYVSKSADGGLSWGSPVEVINIESDPGKRAIDRPWISIDRSGGDHNGTIYITTMNAKESTIGYNPYLTVSVDGGNSFEPWRYLDTAGWLAGSFIIQPMPTPGLTSSGVFHAIYPSLVFTQNSLPQYILVSSIDGGNSFTYNSVFTSDTNPNDDLAKKGYLLIANPGDAEHLAFIYLDMPDGDIDVYMTESFDGGVTWSNGIRINDDSIANNRMQDLVWAAFDTDGDLVISWRDRRNGIDSTYTTSSEIWAAVRKKDSEDFSANFTLTDNIVAYDTILSFSGNDFMCIKLADDTLNAVWGDTRSGKLNIWYQGTSIDGVVQSIQLLSSEDFPKVNVFPNPVKTEITIEGIHLKQVIINDQSGKVVSTFNNASGTDNWKIDLRTLPKGIYFLQIETSEGIVAKKVVKE